VHGPIFRAVSDINGFGAGKVGIEDLAPIKLLPFSVFGETAI
jgi:hypothetical protein